MDSASRPLWEVIRVALGERGLSVRAAARLLHEQHPEKSFDSWHRELRRYVSETNSTYPGRASATTLGRLLGKPDDYFLRRRETLRAERDRLREENESLRRQVELGEMSGDG